MWSYSLLLINPTGHQMPTSMSQQAYHHPQYRSGQYHSGSTSMAMDLASGRSGSGTSKSLIDMSLTRAGSHPPAPGSSYSAGGQQVNSVWKFPWHNSIRNYFWLHHNYKVHKTLKQTKLLCLCLKIVDHIGICSHLMLLNPEYQYCLTVLELLRYWYSY